MTPIADITAARRALRTYLVHADGKLPADTFEQLEKLVDSPSPVDAICRSAELLYARSDELDDTGRDVVAGLASFAATNGWHDLATDNRGGRMALAMRRATGATTEPGQARAQKADNDPAPLAQLARAPATDPVS